MPILPAAFRKDNLLAVRWLLNGVPKTAEGVWFDALQMGEFKQLLFMERILFLFDVTKVRAGKAQIVRINSQQWHLEADIACLGGHIMTLANFRNDDSLSLFPPDTMATDRKSVV